MDFSILICTLEQRSEMLNTLLIELSKQISETGALDKVEILTESDRGQITTGEKRNKLLQRATGNYIAFVDDDDWIYPYYISEILKGIESGPDCLAINGIMTTNGGPPERWEISIKNDYELRAGIYYRFPNHLTPMKREIALREYFPALKIFEDYEWALKLRKQGYLINEVTIEQPLYHYRVNTNKNV